MLLSKKIAYGAISVSFIIILIGISIVSPIFDLSLYTLSSIFIAIAVIFTDIKFGFITYLTSSIILTAMYGIFFSIPFIGFFGLFPIIKACIESKFKMRISVILKLIYFMLITGLLLTVINQIGNYEIEQMYMKALLGIIFVILFFVYDILLSGVIYFIINKLKPQITKN